MTRVRTIADLPAVCFPGTYTIQEILWTEKLLDMLLKRGKPIYRINAGTVLIIRRDLVEKTLAQREKIGRPHRFAPSLEGTFPKSLIGLQNEEAKAPRSRLLYYFRPKQVEIYKPLIQAITQEHISRWQQEDAGSVSERMYLLALDIIVTIFVYQDSPLEEQLDLVRAIQRLTYYIGLKFKIHSGLGIQVDIDNKLTIIKEIIQEYIDKPEGTGVILKDWIFLLHSFKMTQQEFIDELCTLLLAGHETTANVLTFAIYRALDHYWVENRVIDDSNKISVSTKELNLQAFVREILRWYGAIPIFQRETMEDYVLDGVLLPKGTILYITTHGINHSHDIWGEDATIFNPACHFRSPQQLYSPIWPWVTAFGRGSRSCVAGDFAMAEIYIILEEIFRTCRIECQYLPSGSTILWPNLKLRDDFAILVRPRN